MISFKVYGQALPKGSAKAFVIKGTNRAVVTSSTKGLKGWEEAIRHVAVNHVSELLTGPVSIAVNFYLPRPKSLSVKKYAAHTKRPDLDKLIRGATDALTGIIWKDDSQVWAVVARKQYVAQHEQVPYAEFFIQQEWGGVDEKPTRED